MRIVWVEAVDSKWKKSKFLKLDSTIQVKFAKLLESMVVRYLWKCLLILDNVLLRCSWKAQNSLMKKTLSTGKMSIKEFNGC